MRMSSHRVAHAFLVCLLQPVVPAATLALFGRYIWTGETLARSIPFWVLLAITASGAAAVALVVGGALLRAGRLTPGEIGWRRERPARALLLGIVGAAAATAALLGTAALFGDDPWAGLRQMLDYSPSQRALFAIVGVTIAVAEESLFRGYLHRELTPRLGFPAAYLLAAGFYAFWHFPMLRMDSMIARFGQGLVYGALRGRDRSLVTAATAHALCWGFVGLY
jgi:membrane protease YdiL (CAAX protease family)